MNGDLNGETTVSESALADNPGKNGDIGELARWEAGQELEWHRAETERLRVLIDFLARPIHAPGGADPDPDIVTAYNLAVEAALNGIRRGALGRTVPPTE